MPRSPHFGCTRRFESHHCQPQRGELLRSPCVSRPRLPRLLRQPPHCCRQCHSPQRPQRLAPVLPPLSRTRLPVTERKRPTPQSRFSSSSPLLISEIHTLG